MRAARAHDANRDSNAVRVYELLTLQPAFEGPDRKRCLDNRHVRWEPAPPRKINPAIPQDLGTSVLKCLAHETSRRYQRGGELAADLRCFLQDRPIRARRASWVERPDRNRTHVPASRETDVASDGVHLWLVNERPAVADRRRTPA